MSEREMKELINLFPGKWYPFHEIARLLQVSLEAFVEWQNCFEVPIFLVNGVQYMIRDNITWGIRYKNIPYGAKAGH